jgi:hypothetical protein
MPRSLAYNIANIRWCEQKRQGVIMLADFIFVVIGLLTVVVIPAILDVKNMGRDNE